MTETSTRTTDPANRSALVCRGMRLEYATLARNVFAMAALPVAARRQSRARKYAVNGYCPEGSVNEGGGILEQGPDGRWNVYGWERGTASLVRSFDDEDQACRFFYDSLTRTLPEPVELTPEQRADLVARARRQQAERLRERGSASGDAVVTKPR